MSALVTPGWAIANAIARCVIGKPGRVPARQPDLERDQARLHREPGKQQ
jgi:hypothetical protein